LVRIRSILTALTAAILAIPLTTTAGDAATPTLQPRVIGGAPIPITSAPWQVLVSIRGQEYCGGSLLNATWVLTAAHCVDRVSTLDQVRVFAGSDQLSAGTAGNAITRVAAGIVVHPEWNRRTFTSDVALISLNEPITATARTGTIALPDTIGDWPPAGSPAFVIGWGVSNASDAPTEQLQRGDVLVLASPGDPTCGAYGARYDPTTQLCAGLPAGGVDTCQGDSGGALTVMQGDVPVLAGIASTGIECALAEFPGIYTRVTTFVPWVTSIVGPFGMAPGAPRDLRVRSPRAGRLRVQWQPPEGTSPVREYRATARGKSCTTTATTCVIRGLPRGRKVVVRVTAVNEIGSSPAVQDRVRVR
jgi:trypsin